MIIVSYDFEDDKARNRFSKFLEKYGHRIQYSVFEIHNSQRILQNILTEIELKYKDNFTGADSIIIFRFCESCKKKVRRYGYAKYEEEDLIFI
jgi:CRISPR-associated protein Cas2